MLFRNRFVIRITRPLLVFIRIYIKNLVNINLSKKDLFYLNSYIYFKYMNLLLYNIFIT